MYISDNFFDETVYLYFKERTYFILLVKECFIDCSHV